MYHKDGKNARTFKCERGKRFPPRAGHAATPNLNIAGKICLGSVRVAFLPDFDAATPRQTSSKSSNQKRSAMASRFAALRGDFDSAKNAGPSDK